MTVAEAEAHIQRGRIVRSLAEHGGTARTDEYFEAMADAAIFNGRHPAIAIPKPYKILGCYVPVCLTCHGEGVIARNTVYRDGVATIGTVLCAPCQGSGFEGVLGYGDAARIKVASPKTVPR